ncbi:MAG: SDR family oxidoreductase [Planctomycetales bacterium]|nr:SDR family oxidoreductase [Planctomycetales bacterium]
MSKKIIVTGSQGYIGTLLVQLLCDVGYNVIGIDSGLYRGQDCGACSDAANSLTIDIRDLEPQHLEGAFAVCHLAALSNDPLGNIDPALTMDINCQGSLHVARIAKAAGVQRFLFSSSCSTYGAAGDEYLDEYATLNPITAYGVSKVNSEKGIRELADESFCPVYLRNATAYGFSPRLRLDLVVNDFVSAAFLNKRIFIKSDGTPWRPLVHVRDICAAFQAMLEADRSLIFNRAFNIGSTAENYRVSELAEIVRHAVPDCEVIYDPAGGPDKRCYRVCCDLVRDVVPNFQPQWTVAQGVAELLEGFMVSGLSSSDLELQRFHRLPVLRQRLQSGVFDSQLRPTVTHFQTSSSGWQT